MPYGCAFWRGRENSRILPSAFIRPMEFVGASVNQRFPSGPDASSAGVPSPWSRNLVTAPRTVTRSISRPPANQRLPPGPVTMEVGLRSLGLGLRTNSVIAPAGVARAIAAWERDDSRNQRLPSGPVTIPRGALSGVGIGNSVRTPAGVIRPSMPVQNSVNQRLPSGPEVMPSGPRCLGRGNAVTLPAGVTRRIHSCWSSPVPVVVSQMFPSGPVVMEREPEYVAGTLNSVMAPAGVMRPTRFRPVSKNQTLPSGPRVIPLRLAVPHPAHDEPGGEGLATAYSTTPPEARFVEAGEVWAGECDVGGIDGDDCRPTVVLHPTRKRRHSANQTRIPLERPAGHPVTG